MNPQRLPHAPRRGSVRPLRLRPVLAIAVVAVNSAAQQQTDDTVTDTALHQVVDRHAGFGFAGTVHVHRGDRELLARGYGLADREAGRTAPANAVSTVGSITKQFTAAAVLRLEMQGKLRTNDALTEHLDGVPADKRRITLHHLLTHTAGLVGHLGFDFDPVERDALVTAVLAAPLRRGPGERYEYSNLGYSVLAAVVERASGQRFEDFLTEQLFEPAGLRDTGYPAPGPIAERLLIGYRDGQRWGTVSARYAEMDGAFWYLKGNGGIHSTGDDLIRWLRALRGDKVLSAAARKQLFHPHVDEGSGRSHYGYGWVVQTDAAGNRFYWHDGGNGIFSAVARTYPDLELDIAVLASSSDYKAQTVMRDLVTLLVAAGPARAVPSSAPPRTVSADPAELERIAGTYPVGDGQAITVRVEGDALRIEADGWHAFSLLHDDTAVSLSQHDAKNTKIRDFLAAAVTADADGVRKVFANARHADGMLQRFEQDSRRRAQRLGEYRAHRVLGTLPMSERDRLVTLVRYTHAAGAIVRGFVWSGDSLMGFVSNADRLVGSPLYRPAPGGTFVSFAPSSGKVSTVRFEAEREAPRMVWERDGDRFELARR